MVTWMNILQITRLLWFLQIGFLRCLSVGTSCTWFRYIWAPHESRVAKAGSELACSDVSVQAICIKGPRKLSEILIEDRVRAAGIQNKQYLGKEL